jgi:hypothetical protein
MGNEGVKGMGSGLRYEQVKETEQGLYWRWDGGSQQSEVLYLKLRGLHGNYSVNIWWAVYESHSATRNLVSKWAFALTPKETWSSLIPKQRGRKQNTRVGKSEKSSEMWEIWLVPRLHFLVLLNSMRVRMVRNTGGILFSLIHCINV